MKKYRIVKLLGIVLIFCLSLIAIYYVFKPTLEEKQDSDAIRFANEYKDISTDNIFVYKTEEQIIDILKNKTGIVYLGFPECIWCHSYVSMLNDVAKQKDIREIYYYDIREARESNTNGYKEIVNLLSDYLYTDDSGKKRILVPDVTFVINGKIMWHDNETCNMATSDIDAYWTKEKINTFKQKLANKIDEVFEGQCISC